MSLALSQRAARTVQSEIRVMSIECEKVKGINLAQGVCDTEVPEPVREAAKRAIDGGINSYTRAEGLAPIREAIAQKDAALQRHPVRSRDRRYRPFRFHGRLLCFLPGPAESRR